MKVQNLDKHLDGDPLMTISLVLEGRQPVVFNTVDMLKINSQSYETDLEKISQEIGYINGMLELFRDREDKVRVELKRIKESTWIDTKTNHLDGTKPFSDKRVDMMVNQSEEVIDVENQIRDLRYNTSRLEGFYRDLNGKKVALQTLLNARVSNG